MIVVNIDIEPICRDYLLCKYGGEPLRLHKKRDAVSDVIRAHLIKTPVRISPYNFLNQPTSVVLPYYSDRDPRVYNFIPSSAHKIINDRLLHVMIFQDFDYYMAKNALKQGINQSIWVFLEMRGLNPTAFDRLRRRYYRQREAVSR